jgi:hypothetical protein
VAQEIEIELKPFDVLAEQFSMVAAYYKHAQSVEQKKYLLSVMRLILDEADSLQLFWERTYADAPPTAARLFPGLPHPDLPVDPKKS